jgi:CheY-like chemotaxis protein
MAHNRRKSGLKKLGEKQILVVEDHPFVGEVLTALLTLFDHPSHAESGSEALKQIKQKRPDIILLDLGLPRYERFRICKVSAPKRDDKVDSHSSNEW